MNRFFIYVSKEGNRKEKNFQVAAKVSEEILARHLLFPLKFIDHRVGIFVICANPEKAKSFVNLQETMDIVSVAEGYLYNRKEVGGKIVSTVSDIIRSDAEILASSIRQESTKVTNFWQGQYTAFRYDKKTGNLVLLTDRYGLKPIYFAETQEYFIVSHDLKMMLDVFPIPRVLDRAGAAQLISMELIFDDRTLVEAIKRLPNAVNMEIHKDRATISQYWDYPFHQQHYLSDRREILETTKAYLKQAIQIELSKAPDSTAIALSGGMDSRLIAAYAHRINHQPLNTFTIGTNTSRCVERKLAKQIAEAVDARWDFGDYREFLDVSTAWPQFVEWTGGWQSIHQSWSFPWHEQFCALRSYNRVLNGYAFDVQLATNPSFAISGHGSIEQHVKHLLGLYHAIDYDFARNYFTPKFTEELVDSLADSLVNRLKHLEGAKSSEIADYFVWATRIRTYTAAEANINRIVENIGMPFLEYNLFDCCMKIPHEIKAGHTLYFQLFLEEFKNLRHIPYSGTRVSIDCQPGRKEAFLELINKIEHYIKRLSRGRLERSPVSFPAMFRHCPERRNSVLELMKEHRVIDAGLVESKGLKKLIDEIDQGKDYLYNLLERIATVELTISQILH